MKAAFEAVLHAAVVVPVCLFAALIDGAVRLAGAASSAADRVAGEPRSPRSGFGDLRVA